MRLDRYLCQVTDLSRSEARSAIRAGRVCVDGVAVRQASRQVNMHTPVVLDEYALTPPLPRYFMLNKPAGVVCATEDPSHRTALDLFDIVRPERLHIAGRLDIDATGLVLVTDDGQWSHRITSPNKACGKTYRVVLAEALRDQDVMRIRQGINLHREAKPTRPARLQMLGGSQLRLTITEGKYHQVKRMFAAVGNRVLSLHRESIGALVLDENLASGAYRSLTPEEVEFFN
jgi:16S rRNA pseudouridine516 synthase